MTLLDPMVAAGLMKTEGKKEKRRKKKKEKNRKKELESHGRGQASDIGRLNF